jgi:hypothetical protein
LTEKKISENLGAPYCKGCPETLKKANDFHQSLEILKFNGSSLWGLTEKTRRKSGCPPLQTVQGKIEKKPMIDIKEEEMENLKGNKKNILAGKMIWLA